MQINGQNVLTAKQAAARLGITPATLRRQRIAGQIEATQAGRDYFYTEAAIRRYRAEVQQPAGRRSRAGLLASQPGAVAAGRSRTRSSPRDPA